MNKACVLLARPISKAAQVEVQSLPWRHEVRAKCVSFKNGMERQGTNDLRHQNLRHKEQTACVSKTYVSLCVCSPGSVSKPSTLIGTVENL